jgi:hypothetical protein
MIGLKQKPSLAGFASFMATGPGKAIRSRTSEKQCGENKRLER